MNSKTLATIVILAVVVTILYSFLTMRDHRTAGERVSDAVDAIPQGVDKAARQLESRTPGEKLGDAVQDTGEKVGNKIKDNTH